MVKVTLKGGGGKRRRGWASEVWGLLSFAAFMHIGCISAVVVEGTCVRGCRGLEMFTLGTIA
jgi:hypothetical protein